MELVAVFVVLAVVFSSGHSKSLPDEASVVSIYTTVPTTSGTSGIDVYQQIANNLAERISTPVLSFFGINKNKTENKSVNIPKSNIEWFDDVIPKPEENEVESRDVEELSEEVLKMMDKKDKKPEKITLFNSYLPLAARIQENVTTTEKNFDFDDEFDLDKLESDSKMEGPFIFILEWLGSIVQLVWGAIQAVFMPKSYYS